MVILASPNIALFVSPFDIWCNNCFLRLESFQRLSHTCSMTESRAQLKVAILFCRLVIWCCIAAISFLSFKTRFISLIFDRPWSASSSTTVSVDDSVSVVVEWLSDRIPDVVSTLVFAARTVETEVRASVRRLSVSTALIRCVVGAVSRDVCK